MNALQVTTTGGDAIRRNWIVSVFIILIVSAFSSAHGRPFYDQQKTIQIRFEDIPTKLKRGDKEIENIISRWYAIEKKNVYRVFFNEAYVPLFKSYFPKVIPDTAETVSSVRSDITVKSLQPSAQKMQSLKFVPDSNRQSVDLSEQPMSDPQSGTAQDREKIVKVEVKDFLFSLLDANAPDAGIGALLRDLGEDDVVQARVLEANGFQLDLSDCELRGSAEILIGNESVVDGEKTVYLQRFDRETLRAWGNKTALFNSPNFSYMFLDPVGGEIVCKEKAKLGFVYFQKTEQESDISVAFDQSPVEPAVSPAKLQSDPASGATEGNTETSGGKPSPFQPVGRLHPVGCTAWIASTPTGSRLVTAGHCCCDDQCGNKEWRECTRLNDSILQFEATKSRKNGRLIHPDPILQYKVAGVGPLDFDGEGCEKIGNDWAIIDVVANKDPSTNAPLWPTDTQGGGFAVTDELPQIGTCGEKGDKPCVTVVGYRANYGDRKRHRTRQSSEGVLVAGDEKGGWLKHTAESAKGSSGGPILVKDANDTYTAIGIHTDGFRYDCNGPINAGTSFRNQDFSDAVEGR